MRWPFTLSVLNVASFFRVACLILAVASALTFYVWNYKPDYINSIDSNLSSSYFEKYEDQLVEVKALFAAKDYRAAVHRAKTYLSEMSHIGKRDTLYPTKRRLNLILVRSSIRLGSPYIADALPYVEDWTESDERDVTALELYIKVLSKMQGKEKELHSALNLFHYRYPGKKISISGAK